jgi:hypothetical protein
VLAWLIKYSLRGAAGRAVPPKGSTLPVLCALSPPVSTPAQKSFVPGASEHHHPHRGLETSIVSDMSI